MISPVPPEKKEDNYLRARKTYRGDKICHVFFTKSLTRKIDISLAHLPAAHIAGVQGYLVNNCYLGGTCYWMPKFDFPKFCEYVKKYKVTSMFTVPPIYLLIAKSPLVRDHFDTWDDAVTGAAPMGADLQAEAGNKLGRGMTSVRQTWGLSETVCFILASFICFLLLPDCFRYSSGLTSRGLSRIGGGKKTLKRCSPLILYRPAASPSRPRSWLAWRPKAQLALLSPAAMFDS